MKSTSLSPFSAMLSSPLRPPSSPNSFTDELDDLMRDSSPPPEDNDSNDNPIPGEETASAGDSATFEGGQPSSIGPIRNELALARRLATQNKLNPHQRTTLEELVKGPPLVRDILLFIQQCTVENKVEEIVVAAPRFEVSDELLENIKSVVIAVLLSSKLPAYKGDVPKNGVLVILLEKRHHFPKNYDDDASVKNTIEAAIGEELVQTRSKIKKFIKESIDKKYRLFDLATKLVKDSKCAVTVPLCGKLALLRKIYLLGSGSKYWDKVDTRLESIRGRASNDQAKIACVFKNLIKQDKEIYGSKDSDKVTETHNLFQQSIEDSLNTLV